MDADMWFWGKFGLLSLVFMVAIWKMGGDTLSLTWKLLFVLSAPIGVFLALKGKSVVKAHNVGGF